MTNNLSTAIANSYYSIPQPNKLIHFYATWMKQSWGIFPFVGFEVEIAFLGRICSHF